MREKGRKKKVLMAASVASMIDQFNMPNIRLIQEMGYEVHVVCNFKEGSTCDARRLRGLRAELGRMHAVCHQWDCPRGIRSVRECYKAYRQLWELTGRVRFAWMHCHSPVGAALARAVAHRRGIRVIYTAHGFHFYQGAPFKNWLLYYPVEKLLAYWTDVLITVNQEDYRLAKRSMKAGKVCYIPGVGIDLEKFRDAGQAAADGAGQAQPGMARGQFCKEYRIPKDAKVLLSVGELNRGKNHKMAIAALAGLSRQDVYYLICGQGRMEKKLRRYATRLGVGEQVRMPGYQGDMWRIYPNADIFVFPSLREGMPVALMEAMAAGLPCVASDIRGSRELVDGMRFPLGRRGQRKLQDLLGRLLGDGQLQRRCALHNQKKIEGYGWAAVGKRMRRIYAGMGRGWQEVKISVLLATYNPNLGWLEQQLDSISRQTYPFYELIIMDDGSEPGAFQNIQEMVGRGIGRCGRVSLHQNCRNEGSNKAFEKLALMARGDYVAFCDQDDIWEEEKLERLARAARREHAAMAYSDMSVIDENGAQLYPSLRKMRKCLEFVHGDDATAKYLADNCTAGCSMLARADLVREAAPFSQQAYCDQWVAACVSAHGRVAFVDMPLVRYRRHGANQTKSLGQVWDRQGYYERRVLPMCRLVGELKARSIHFRQEREAAAFALARERRDIRGIWKYRRLSRKYAYLDLLMICMPNALVRLFLRVWKDFWPGKDGRGMR